MEAQMENDRRPGRGRRLVDAANGWREGMMLRAQVPGALPHYVGPEIWDEARGDVIASEAETIADDVGPELLTSADERGREGLRGRVIDEMNAALVDVGDTYLAPDGIRYSLSGEGGPDHERSAGEQRPPVVEVLRFEALPLGSGASRRAVVRWSDGTEGEAVRFYSEVLVCEGDLIDKTKDEIRSLHFRRDRDWLQS